jgi:glycosyltransferase involved in cell wall biosynthesis
MSSKVQLSLVIRTRNRALQLAECLRSLTRLRYSGSWELVIVDNGSKDETQNVINSYRESLPLKIVIEPLAGGARAHNRGWKTSRGKIVAFTDDDCYPAEDFLSSISRCFEEDAGLGFIGGRVLLHDPEDARLTIQEKDSRQELSPGEYFPPGLIHGANFACRRTAIESVGGFDERFGPSAPFVSAEDTDILARLLAEGWPGAYDPRPLVYHHHRRRTPIDGFRLGRQYDRGRGAFYAKCVLNPKLRMVYLRKWHAAICRQSLRTTARELVAGAEFCIRVAAEQCFRRSAAARETKA